MGSGELAAVRPFWLLASGFWLLASGFWLLASGCPLLRTMPRIVRSESVADRLEIELAFERVQQLVADLAPVAQLDQREAFGGQGLVAQAAEGEVLLVVDGVAADAARVPAAQPF